MELTVIFYEFSDFIASVIKFKRVLMAGDFKVHVNDTSDSFADNF